jgi:hypothetical protein
MASPHLTEFQQKPLFVCSGHVLKSVLYTFNKFVYDLESKHPSGTELLPAEQWLGK